MSQAKEIPPDWFVDPVSKECLIKKAGAFYSSTARYASGCSGKFWNFMPGGLTQLDGPGWKAWSMLQDNGVSSYKNDPCNNLAIGERKDCLQFSEFCDLKGNVLDIGVGPQRCPAHIVGLRKKNTFFIGIDPLVGQQPRSFAFVRGLGEYLPFRNRLFDRVLFVTSLDHFVDPAIALREAVRVLKGSGFIYIWIGVKKKGAAVIKSSPAWYRKLEVPSGAEDFFHYRRLNAKKAEKYFKDAGLTILLRQAHQVDKWRKNYFYKLKI